MILRYLFATLILACLQGCFQMDSAYYRTAEYLISGKGKTPEISDALKARGYLKVVINHEITTYLALGYVLDTPLGQEEIWYSADGETIHLLHGLIVNTAGLGFDWKNVKYSIFDSWEGLLEKLASGQFIHQAVEVTRDVPGEYLYGEKEQYLMTHSSIGQGNQHALLVRPLNSKGEVWKQFQFVMDKNGTVVSSSQCLAKNVCLDLFRVFPAEMAVK